MYVKNMKPKRKTRHIHPSEGVFGEIPGTGQGQDEAGVHGNGDTPRPLATVAHLVEVMEFDVHGDSPGDEDDGQYDGDSHGKGKV